MHTSIKLETPCEFINITPLNPLISKCQIKVCYVGDDPNRNRSIITKDVARQMANSLPGSPIVGFYNDSKKDFEEHNRIIDVSNGKFEIKDTTFPYGFVDLGARCWFQQFKDDGQVVREYLMTEGYLWTGQYPECQRIIDKGNNQSMELDEETLDATWAKDSNGKPQFFIVNEAIVSKLCILGEDVEPCFEGSNITKYSLSFDTNFKQELFSMMKEVKELLDRGGTQVFTTYAVKVGDSLWSALYSFLDTNHENTYSIAGVFEDDNQKYAVLQNRTDEKYYRLDFSMSENDEFTSEDDIKEVEFTPGETQFALNDIEAFETEFKKAKEDEEKKGKEDKSGNPNPEDKSEGDKTGKPEEDPEDDDEEKKKKEKEKFACGGGSGSGTDDKKKKKYSLEEIPEYSDLLMKFSQLQTTFNELKESNDSLTTELEELRTFKAESEKAKKQDMINSFAMLSDEDKKDVSENIDKYSLEDIEAKLSIICVRNKVNFNFDDDNQQAPTTFNLGGDLYSNESTPAWVKAVLDTAKSMD